MGWPQEQTLKQLSPVPASRTLSGSSAGSVSAPCQQSESVTLQLSLQFGAQFISPRSAQSQSSDLGGYQSVEEYTGSPDSAPAPAPRSAPSGPVVRQQLGGEAEVAEVARAGAQVKAQLEQNKLEMAEILGHAENLSRAVEDLVRPSELVPSSRCWWAPSVV